jgi:lysophospholipase L1-like esterase
METIDEIKQQAEAVKNATQVGENTAMRVGGALAGLADIAKQQDVELGKKADKETVNVELGKKFDKENVAQESGESEDKVMSQKAVSDKFTSVETNMVSLNNEILPFTSTPKDLLGVVREVYIEGIEDKESTYKLHVAKRSDNLQLTINKEGESISDYYVSSTSSDYDVNKKGIVTLSPLGDNGKKAYVFVDFSKLEVPFDKNYPLDISVATNLDFVPSIKAMLYKTQIEGESTVASKWYGKTLLAIGDSVTAGSQWAQRVGTLLGMSVRVHAKGGIGIIQMVDGDGSGDAPEEYDPNYGTGGKLYKLNDKDVANVDVICIMGFYNERRTAINNAGNKSDMYPSQNSFIGKLNYVIKRIYEELDKANNFKCKIVFVSAHKYGSYPYDTETAYEDGDKFLEATKIAAEYNSLYFIDLMNGGGINKYNWKYFQNSSTNYNQRYIPKDGVNDATNKPFDSKDEFPDASTHKGYFVTLKGEEENNSYESDGTQWVKRGKEKGRVWLGDQLHPNNAGYEKIGDFIAGHLLNI